jgi:hypothetical protein
MANGDKRDWTGLGVLATVFVAGFGAGYLLLSDVLDNREEILKEKVAELETLNEIDGEKLQEMLAKQVSEYSARDALQQKIDELELENTELAEAEADLLSIQNELRIQREFETKRASELEALVVEDLEINRSVFVEKGTATWLVPSRIGVSVGLIGSSYANVTVTNVASDVELKVSEHLDVPFDNRDCRLILVSVGWPDENANFTFTCPPIPEGD